MGSLWDMVMSDPFLGLLLLAHFVALDSIRRNVRVVGKFHQENREVLAKHKEQQAIYDEYLKAYYPKLGPKPEAKH